MNSVDDDGNTLLVSARNTHALYLLERATGKLVWRLAGKQSDSSVADNAAFAWQHDGRRRSVTEVIVFDNHYDKGSASTSRGLLLTIDESARTAVLKAEYANAGNAATSKATFKYCPTEISSWVGEQTRLPLSSPLRARPSLRRWVWATRRTRQRVLHCRVRQLERVHHRGLVTDINRRFPQHVDGAQEHSTARI
ncbi:hypothetical protein AOC05_03795 [Arthrobacter alpinus]|uniref:Arylsulfotransferase (ASST) n=1 Tax=Arthrobacter alpinus TaxID=656366 RepID=A0A0M4QVC1_9MICC|nr:arylsulfotransferase family protein [Arthrobacter alpinus]ALE91661.1 hypothetical protein AOC05_03795 [Arthrobacter alpinus]